MKGKRRLKKWAKIIKNMGSCAIARKGDVSRAIEVEDMMREIQDTFGRLDIVVNNAGIRPVHTHILEIDEREWNKILEVNLKGVFNVCKAAVKMMIPQRSGKIINISSIAGRMGSETGVAYAASKAGVIGLSFALATELAPYGITVNVVAPGGIDTEWYEKKEEKELVAERCPMRRLGKPEEVAEAVIFLIKDDYITGEIVNVDGGRFLRKF